MKPKHGSALVALGVGMLLAGCGSDDDAGTANTQAIATTTPASSAAPAASAGSGGATAAAFNDADVTFAQGMIPHHEQAIAMAEMALDPAVGASAQVVDLATRIKAAQDPEIQLMSGWLSAWGQPATMDTGGGHDMSDMEGMMSAEEMDELGAMRGAEFDARWMQMMIEHHEGAIAQATTEKGSGVNPDALALADQIIAAQQAEIDEMQALLG